MSEKLCFISGGLAVAVPENQAIMYLNKQGGLIIGFEDVEWEVDSEKLGYAQTPVQAYEWMENNITSVAPED